jgi:hypothetical protein
LIIDVQLYSKRITDERESYGLSDLHPFQPLIQWTEPQIEKARALLGEDKTGSAIRSALKRDYFRRRWVIQETTMAREIIINCGSSQLGWKTFRQLIAVIRCVVDVTQPSDRTDLWLADMPHAIHFSIITTRRHHHEVRRPHHHELEHWQTQRRFSLNLMSLLKEYEATECRDPHDLIFAFLGIVEEWHRDFAEILKPSYGQDVEQVFPGPGIYLLLQRPGCQSALPC